MGTPEIAPLVAAVERAEKRLRIRVAAEAAQRAEVEQRKARNRCDPMDWRFEPEAFSMLLVFQTYLFDELARGGILTKEDAARASALILADRCQ